jgi:hypothetical protein
MLTFIAILVFQTIPCEGDAQSRWRLCRVLAYLVEVPQHRHPRTPTGQTYGKTLFLIICNCSLSVYNSGPFSTIVGIRRICVTGPLHDYAFSTSMNVINFSTITWPVNDDGENNFCPVVLPHPVSASCLSYSRFHLFSPSITFTSRGRCQYTSINEHSGTSYCNNVTTHSFSTLLLRKNLYLG